jgi:hypothetical protein
MIQDLGFSRPLIVAPFAKTSSGTARPAIDVKRGRRQDTPTVGNALCGVPGQQESSVPGVRNATEGVPYRFVASV